METKGQLGLILGGFIVVIIGLSLIPSVADQAKLVQVSSRDISNETVTLSSNIGKTANDEILTFTSCRNVSNQVSFVINTDCNYTASSGSIAVNPSNNTGNSVQVTYSYEPDTYVQSQTSSALIDLNILFFAIAVMIIGVGMAYKGLKDWMG